jgi:hypothetical protein
MRARGAIAPGCCGVEPLEGRRLMTLTVGPPPVDPTISAFAPPETAIGATTHSVIVNYNVAAGVDVRTIDASDVVITGPGAGALR